jgi:TPR repeat protein
VKRQLWTLCAAAFLVSAAAANPRAAFEAARTAYRRGDLARAQKALHLTWKRLPPSLRRGAAGAKVLVLVGRTHARRGDSLGAGVALGRALRLMEAQSPVDRDAVGSVRRLLQEIAMGSSPPLGPALLRRAERASSEGARLSHALAAEVLLRSDAEFGDATDLCRLARALVLFPPSDARNGEATRVLIDAAATGHRLALEQLADWYRKGIGVPRNAEMANRYDALATDAASPPQTPVVPPAQEVTEPALPVGVAASIASD